MDNKQLYVDNLERKLEVVEKPQRIISLVPSITELLFDLGLENRISGITKYCIHPTEKDEHIKVVGGTDGLNLNLIDEINPDLIIANAEENNKEEILKLAENYPVFVSDVKSYDEALNFIIETGLITGENKIAEYLVGSIVDKFSELNKNDTLPSALYLIWKDPYMSIGGDTFISSMLNTAGFQNILSDKKRYPKVLISDIINLKPEYIFLSTEPYPFKQKDINELQRQLSDTKIIIVDGEMFSWFGSRLVLAPEYFMKLAKECNMNKKETLI